MTTKTASKGITRHLALRDRIIADIARRKAGEKRCQEIAADQAALAKRLRSES